MTKPLTEAQMQNSLKHAALQLGFMVYHTQYSIGADRGFPDLIIVGYGSCLVFEIKGPRGKVRDGQYEWISAFTDAGIPAMIIWPGDYERALAMIEDVYRAGMEQTA